MLLFLHYLLCLMGCLHSGCCHIVVCPGRTYKIRRRGRREKIRWGGGGRINPHKKTDETMFEGNVGIRSRRSVHLVICCCFRSVLVVCVWSCFVLDFVMFLLLLLLLWQSLLHVVECCVHSDVLCCYSSVLGVVIVL